MKNKELLEEFHALAEKLDIKIMKAKGDFLGGDCIVNEKKVRIEREPYSCMVFGGYQSQLPAERGTRHEGEGKREADVNGYMYF